MYEARGYSAIPVDRFKTFITRAGLFAQEKTLGRVKWSFASQTEPTQEDYPDYNIDEFEDAFDLREQNIHGICTLADLYFRSEAAVGESGATLISFINEGYHETYEGLAQGGYIELLNHRLSSILFAHFSAEQLSRRVML